MRRAMVAVGVGLLAFALTAGGATAGGNGKHFGKLAGKQCAQERKTLGHEAFEELYGKPAMPNCLGVKAAEIKNASKACKAERAEIGAEAFAEEYGSNKNKRNAFGKCVSGMVHAEAPAPTP